MSKGVKQWKGMLNSARQNISYFRNAFKAGKRPRLDAGVQQPENKGDKPENRMV
jgi:hypothetical protein